MELGLTYAPLSHVLRIVWPNSVNSPFRKIKNVIPFLICGIFICDFI
jgi:hypothetical protein